MPLEDRVLARIPLTPDQEMHLRSRQAPGIPPMLDLALFNTEGGGYRLACVFPDAPEVVQALTAALTAHEDSRG